MTFSVVARDATSGVFGVAVASKFLAVGAAVPAAATDAGALATQAYANLHYRGLGLDMLRDGTHTAAAVVETLTQSDTLRPQRQLGVVATHGDGASWTGAECIPWAGHRTGDGYAIQGNCLTGEDVVDACESAWLESSGSLAQRLAMALAAGDAAGGDKRGRQSAALLVVSPNGGYGGGSDVLVDLRVDDHPTPVRELGRLLELHELYFGTPDPATVITVDAALRAELATALAGLGYATLWDWVGVENLEERYLDDDRIDPVVLEVLRRHAGA